jgi:hypothetical protein
MCEQLLSATARPQLAEHLERLRVDEQLAPLDASLRRVLEPDRVVAEQAYVVASHRGEAYRPVLLGVLLPADAEEAAIQEADCARQHALTRQPGELEVLRDGAPSGWQRPRELEHPLELLRIPPFPPGGVVEVLTAPGGIDPDRLDVPVRPGTDPYVAPRGRDGEPPDASQRRLVPQRLAMLVRVREAPAVPPAPEARERGVGDAQPAHRSRRARSPRRGALGADMRSGSAASASRCRAARPGGGGWRGLPGSCGSGRSASSGGGSGSGISAGSGGRPSSGGGQGSGSGG